ncbi:monocarboxylate transporter 14-like [Lineus longissimus]|uniref:monocarboxylate transporter 14-like n=1 Tax=Lineus longissimus TaxID=88925 RepID=UPI002B4EFE6D
MEEPKMEVRINKSLDHGWSWMVLLGCFSIFFLVQGIDKCMGLIYLELLEKLEGSASTTAWVIAIATAGRLIVAPFTSALCKRFGCRIISIVGGLIASVGLLLGSFPISIPYEFFSLGLCYGLGTGLYYPCALIMTVKYFDKRLGLAGSVSASGGGLGMMIFPPLFDFLISTFGFGGTLFVLSAINLHVVVVALLFRPPIIVTAEENEAPIEQDGLLNGGICDESKFLSSDEGSDPNGAKNDSVVGRTIKSPTVDNQEVFIAKAATRGAERNNANIHSFSHGAIETDDIFNCEKDTCTKSMCSCPDLVRECSTNEASDACIQVGEGKFTTNQSAQSSNDDLGKTSGRCCTKRPAFLPDLSLLKYPGFWMYLGQTMLVGFAQLSFMTFFPALAKERGATLSDAAMLLTVSSIVDIPAKLLTGFLVDRKMIRPHRRHVLNTTIFLNAMVISLTPLTFSFANLAAVGIALGLTQGVYIAQLLVVFVDIVGRERQADGLGLAMFSRSISLLCGPSVIGFIKDITKSYNPSFYMCGAVGATAGFLFLIQFFVPVPASKSSSTIIEPYEDIKQELNVPGELAISTLSL